MEHEHVHQWASRCHGTYCFGDIIRELAHCAQYMINNCIPKKYRQISNISRTYVGNNIVDHSDVVGISPVGAAPTTSSFSA